MINIAQPIDNKDFKAWWELEKNKTIPPMDFSAILGWIALNAWNAADICRWQKTLPEIPCEAHLASMATCYRHDFALLDEQSQASILTTMKQLFEEATGRGFYELTEAHRQHKSRTQIETEMMAECTDLLRQDLIEAGLIPANVAPMFLTEAILHAFQQEKLKTPESVMDISKDDKLFMHCELSAVIEALESSDREGCLDNMDALRIVKKAQRMINQATLTPVPMNLTCPACNEPHVDEGVWASRPHKTHECQRCKHFWQPHPYPTVGIADPLPRASSAPSLAAIEFAMTLGNEAAGFLGLWSEGEWGSIRKEWPNCPEGVLVAAIETEGTVMHSNSEDWQPLTEAGQVNAGDKLRFNIGEQKYAVIVDSTLYAGTDREELIYDSENNYYLITSMVMSNTSQAKNVEFMNKSLIAGSNDLIKDAETFRRLCRLAMHHEDSDLEREGIDEWMFPTLTRRSFGSNEVHDLHSAIRNAELWQKQNTK